VKRLLFISLLVTTAASAASDLSGNWELTGTYLGSAIYGHLNLKETGEKLTGDFDGLALEGTLRADQLQISVTRSNGEAFGTFQGKLLASGKLEGTALWVENRQVTWSAMLPVKQRAESQTHDFVPKEFHRLFSDAIPPVLRIVPGDTVRTTTVDAGGMDSQGVRRSQGGNPETGPFYVEGAFPGDTLSVKLNKVRLNRDSADSGDQIVGSALGPGYLQETKYNEKFDSTWVLDVEKGVARLKNPSEHLKNYSVKLHPMLGCIAVAPPAHQAYRTGYLGSFGGNMDYNQLGEGVTLYLPVYVPGALLFLGDGHAAQGDGELTGDALETSMQVEFTVNLIKGHSTAYPRAENDEYLMAFGIGNSLPDALQIATTQLVRWLQRDFKLEPNEAAVVLGTAMQYNVAEIVDPLAHVVAKIRKDAVAGLR
jgi:amidase